MAGIPIVLVLLQPDLGTAMMMVVIVLLVVLAVAAADQDPGDAAHRHCPRCARGMEQQGLLHHYQIARLILNPNSHSTNPYVRTSIYNGQQAKNAIGSGGLFGSGIGHGAQTNLGYVPEQQTDFIFTAVGEQDLVRRFGGAALLGVIAWRVLHATVVARDVFGR